MHRNPWMTITEDVVRRGDGSLGTYGVVHRTPGVVVIAIRQDGRFAVVRQFRYPVGSRRWEFPAGTVDHPDEDITHAARRELAEETGMVADTVTVLATLDVAPGFTAQQTSIVVAEQLQAGSPSRDDTEQDMTVGWWSRDEITAAITDGTIVDAQSLAGWAVFVANGR